VGTLAIDQPESHAHIGNNKYEWDLRLNNEIPIELDVHFGAGQAQLDLGSLALRRVNVEMGVGQIQMDLRGAPKHDYTVSVQGGVGEADLKLPNTVGIEASASGGIGDISVRGLTKEAGRWVNEAFHHPGVKVRVDVKGGVGAIHLSAE
jgi:predicted membrane protein